MKYTSAEYVAVKLLESGFKVIPPLSDDEVLALFDKVIEEYELKCYPGPQEKEMIRVVRASLVG